MTLNIKRRSFLKASATVTGGFALGFASTGCKTPSDVKMLTEDWSDLNAFLSIHPSGKITIMSTNPEVGQNIKTAFPMIIADELGADWKDVVVKQAPLDNVNFKRQVAGGSQSIRYSWESLRTAGATARQMLINAAAQKWNVAPSECHTEPGFVIHMDKKLSYAYLAESAALQPVPSEVTLKDIKDFYIIGSSQKNVDIDKIIQGAPQYGFDTQREGMVYANVLRPPAFGQQIKSVNDAAARNIDGVFDVIQFDDKIAVIAKDTWSAMQGKKALQVEYTHEDELETSVHIDEVLHRMIGEDGEVKRNDGDVDKAFSEADQIVERIYEAPFLPHSCMEPMNFFADVKEDGAELFGPIQTPDRTRKSVAEQLGLPEDKVKLMMTRCGGGFGRRLYGDYVTEVAEISKLSGKPVQLLYTREDDMHAGMYRPAVKYKFRASVKDGKITGYELKGAGVNMWNACKENFFPAGAIDNYRVTSQSYRSKVSTAAWRAPVTNFLASAEQSFFDELAGIINVDAVEMRLDLLAHAEQQKSNGVKMDYDPTRFITVVKTAAEKSGWYDENQKDHLGFSAYFSHNTHVAEVAHINKANENFKLDKVTCVFDCGILINPLSALNQVEGGVVDGIGHAMYGKMDIVNGQPEQTNFDKYRLIRMSEAPKVVSHFIDSNEHPTGLGEPTLPPAGGALSNAIFKATGKRLYKQPFIDGLQTEILG